MTGRLSLASVFAATLAALFATPASANDQACTRDTIGPAPAVAAIHPLQASIDAIFEHPATIVATPEGTTDGPSLQMIMVRVKDGKPVMACVDSKESATRFLKAPIEKIRGKHAEEK